MSDSDEESDREICRDSRSDFEKSSAEIDQVYDLLVKLESKNEDERLEAEKQVDTFLKEKQRKSDEELLMKNLVAGCKTVQSRTVISKEDSELEKRRKLSEELKCMGNDCFKQNQFEKAIEYYSSALLQCDQSPILHTNRAQSYIKIRKFDLAIEDCKSAIKLNPMHTKAHIHLAKALQGQGEYQKAINILEIAEKNSKEFEVVIKKYREEAIKDMKQHLLNQSAEHKLN